MYGLCLDLSVYRPWLLAYIAPIYYSTSLFFNILLDFFDVLLDFFDILLDFFAKFVPLFCV